MRIFVYKITQNKYENQEKRNIAEIMITNVGNGQVFEKVFGGDLVF